MSTDSITRSSSTGRTVDLPWLGTWPLRTVFFVIITVIYLLNFQPRTFWAENEAYYALGAQSVLDGHFLVPVIYDTTLADKPPLMFWYIALVSLPFGAVTEFSARLANLIPALLILFLVWRFAATYISTRAAMLAVVVLATAHEFYEVAFEVNTDIMLSAMLLVSWIAMYKIIETGFTWKRWAMLWVPMGIGMLTKGPIAPALSCLVALAFAFPRYGLADGWRRLLSLRPFTGAVVCFAPFVLWCVAVYSQYGRGPLDVILLKHNVQRFVEAFDHQKPWFYYLYTLPIVMLPWTVFLPLLAIQVWREKRAGAAFPAWKTFALAIVAVGFVLFSWSSSKRAYYLLPLMPWLALLLGDVMARLGENRDPARRQHTQKLVDLSAAVMLGILFLYIAVGYPILDNRRSIDELVETVDGTTAPNEKLKLFEEEDPRIMFYLRDSMTFYSDKPKHIDELAEALSREPKVDILSQQGSLKKLLRLSPVPLHVETAADYRGNRFYVLTTDPGTDLRGLSLETIEYLREKEERELD